MTVKAHRVLVVSGLAVHQADRLSAVAGDIAAFTPCSRYEDLPAALDEVRPEVVLSFKIGRAAFPRDVLLSVPSLKWIQAGGAGIDHLIPWPTDRLTVTNSTGIHGDIMAQHVLCMMLMANLNIHAYRRQQAARVWKAYDSLSLAGQTLGIFGFGAVGREVAAVARRMGMRVLAVRASGPGQAAEADGLFGPDAMVEVAAQSDFLAICLPLTTQTRGLIGAAVLDALRPTALLIDVSRGGIVDPAVLLDRLQRRCFAGAALDVFAEEPLPADSPFWSLDNVVVTPHACSDIVGWQQRVMDLFTDNLRRWHAGRPLNNVVDPSRGY